MRRLALVAAVVALAAGCKSDPEVPWAPGQGTQGPTDVPGAPAGLAATPANRAMELAWLPNGASEAVGSYVVYTASAPWQTWSETLPDATRTPAVACCAHTVTDLENDVPYWFAVAAVNSNGEGAMAPPIEATPPGWVGMVHIGTAFDERAAGIVIDSAGNLYIGGDTVGAFPGFRDEVGTDAFVAKLHPNGELAWIQQLELAGNQTATDIAVNESGSVFVSGNNASGVFVWSLTPDGQLRYYSPFGEAPYNAVSYAIAVTGPSAAIAGGTEDTWFGTSGGGTDAFYAVLDSSGGVMNGAQFGTDAADYVTSIHPIGLDGYYLSGVTFGAFPGETNLGFADLFAARFVGLVEDWIQQHGSSGFDYAWDVSPFGDHVYVVGESDGDLITTNHGGYDSVLTRLEDDGDVGYTLLRGTGGHDRALSVAVVGTGLIQVVGEVDAAAGLSVLLMQFDQSDVGTPEGNYVWSTSEYLGVSLDIAGGAPRGESMFITGSVASTPADEDVFVLRVERD